jgi:hypothetical protein
MLCAQEVLAELAMNFRQAGLANAAFLVEL